MSWLQCVSPNVLRLPKPRFYEGTPNTTHPDHDQPYPPLAEPLVPLPMAPTLQLTPQPSHRLLDLHNPGQPRLHVPLSLPRRVAPLNHQLNLYLRATHSNSNITTNITTNTSMSTNTIPRRTTAPAPLIDEKLLTGTKTKRPPQNHEHIQQQLENNNRSKPLRPVRKAPPPPTPLPVSMQLPKDNTEHPEKNQSPLPSPHHLLQEQNQLEQITKNQPLTQSQRMLKENTNSQILNPNPLTKLDMPLPIVACHSNSPTTSLNILNQIENSQNRNLSLNQSSQLLSPNSPLSQEIPNNKTTSTSIPTTSQTTQSTPVMTNTKSMTLTTNTKQMSTPNIQMSNLEDTQIIDTPTLITTKLLAASLSTLTSNTVTIPIQTIPSLPILIKKNHQISTMPPEYPIINSPALTRNTLAMILNTQPITNTQIENRNSTVMNINLQSTKTNSPTMCRNPQPTTPEHPIMILKQDTNPNILRLNINPLPSKPNTSITNTNHQDLNINPSIPINRNLQRVTSYSNTMYNKTTTTKMAMALPLSTSSSHTDISTNSNRHKSRSSNSISHLHLQSPKLNTTNLRQANYTSNNTRPNPNSIQASISINSNSNSINTTNHSLILFPPTGTLPNRTPRPITQQHLSPGLTIRSPSPNQAPIWSTHTLPRAAAVGVPRAQATQGPILRLMPNRYHHRGQQLHTQPTHGQEQPSSSQQPTHMLPYPTPLPDLIPVEFERRTLHTHTIMGGPITYLTGDQQRTRSHPTLPTHYQRIMVGEGEAGNPHRFMPTTHNTRVTRTNPSRSQADNTTPTRERHRNTTPRHPQVRGTMRP